ncbi:RNA ligase (ATP) [Agromyces humi]|uniref:RNA ligase (ATP) n=1 Tax=Agromyces humi TaxID=1766800 RepID=UPI00135C9F0B|nr:RNA ligase (ATP) [Agromyces humi]
MTATLTRTQTRALATIAEIIEVAPIPDADAIERVRVRGWDVVVKKGEFRPGDLCVYIEVDSHLDVTDPRFAFLAPRGTRTTLEGFTGHVLKTAKLRGQYSQGIVFPVAEFPEVAGYAAGDDVTDVLGIVKWEPPIPAALAGLARGAFPSGIAQTDEERIQNLALILTARDHDWIPTEKVDGTSMTAFIEPDYDGIAGRNWDLQFAENHSMWKLAFEHDLHGALRRAYPDATKAAVQGELFGAGVQGNPLKLNEARFAAFTVQVDGVEIPRGEWPAEVAALSVPVYDLPYPATVDEALAQVEGLKSLIAPDRAAEGIVWRAADTAQVKAGDYYVRASWKAISNRYAMKNDR